MPRSGHCPFCRGHEQETPAPVASYCLSGDSVALDAWQVRVVPNLYPALLPAHELAPGRKDDAPAEPHGAQEDAARQEPHPTIPAIAPGDRGRELFAADSSGHPRPARGWHEVVIESPDHRQRLTELRPAEATLVLQAYRERLQVFAADPAMVCGVAFKNCGRDAGMSQEHIHSQLVALPFVPPVLELEFNGARRFRQQSGDCVFCHLSRSAQNPPSRLVAQTDHFLAFCPYASRAPYEIWVLPRAHWARFEQIPPTVLGELAQLLQDVLHRLETCLDHPAYNYVLHSCPFDTSAEAHYHWHIEIIPRVTHLAGLEWGTGVYVNIVSPESAACDLRELGGL